jgi:hypothetical protein
MKEFPWNSRLLCVACDSSRLKLVDVDLHGPGDRVSGVIADWECFSLGLYVMCQQCGHGYIIEFLYDETEGQGITTETDVYRCTGEPHCVIPCGPPPEASEPPAERPRLWLLDATPPEEGA